MKFFALVVILSSVFQVLACERGLSPKSQESQKVQKAKPSGSKVVVARVGDHTITKGDFDYVQKTIMPYSKSQFSGPEGRQKLLNKMIARILLYGEGVRKGVLEEDKVMRILKEHEMDTVSEIVKKKIVAERSDDKSLKRYYGKHEKKYKRNGKVLPFDRVKSAVKRDFSDEILKNYVDELKVGKDVVINRELLEE